MKTLMRTVALLLFLIPGIVKAQKCTEAKDAFTGKITKSAIIPLQGGLLNTTFSTTLLFSKTDTIKTVSFVMMLAGSSEAIKAETISLLVKFDDGEVLKMEPKESTSVIKSNTSLMQGTTIAYTSELSNNLVDKFSSKNIERIRLGFANDQGYDIELKGKKGKEVQSATNCIR